MQPEQVMQELDELELEKNQQREKAEHPINHALSETMEETHNQPVSYSDFRKIFERKNKEKLPRKSMRKLYRIYLKALKSRSSQPAD